MESSFRAGGSPRSRGATDDLCLPGSHIAPTIAPTSRTFSGSEFRNALIRGGWDRPSRILVSQPKQKSPPYGGLFCFGLWRHRSRSTFDKIVWVWPMDGPNNPDSQPPRTRLPAIARLHGCGTHIVQRETLRLRCATLRANGSCRVFTERILERKPPSHKPASSVPGPASVKFPFSIFTMNR